MIDYWILHGSKRSSADAMRARLKLVRRFIGHEIETGVLREPVLPKVLHNDWLTRFREWGSEIDRVTQRRRDRETGEWTVSRRERAKSTVEESIIQLKAALRFNVKRMEAVPELKHLPRAAVTPERNFRLSLDQIAEMLDYTAEGDPELRRIRHD
ncbi:hypothetical protein [Sphingomonas sp. PB1R3]|uniref:hypothetical protein n=1 Tax=Sphingomonas flavida TaxID=3096154 RepID=UPI002FC68F7D